MSEKEFQEFQTLIERIEAVKTDNFFELAKILGRDPLKDFVGADLSRTDLSGGNLSHADLRYVDLSGANLRDADLSGANLSAADLNGADLSGANLRDADLRDADLSGANLNGADLSGAILNGADLSGANRRDADLSGAILNGANLSGADLSGTVLHRRQAYLNLIEVLVSCPSAEEPAILKANQNLIDAGLVQTMLDYAVNLATRDDRDYIDASNRLINIVVTLLVTLRNADEGSQEFSEAIEYYEQVRAICQERSYQQMEEMLLYYIRFFYRYTNDYPKAIESSERLLVIAQNRKERFLEAEALLHLGIDYQGLRNLDEARNDYEQSLAIAEQIDTEASKKLQVDILNALGESYNPPYDWDFSKATETCQRSLQIAKEIGYRYGEAIALTHIGKVHYWAPGQGRNFPEAIRCYEEAKTIFQEIENLQGEWDALYHLQDSYNYTSEYAKAIDYNQRLLTIARNLNNRLLEASVLLDLGRNYDALGYLQKEIARNYYQQSLEIVNQMDSQDARQLRVRSLQGLGGYYMVNGDLPAAEKCYEESLSTAENIGEEQGQGNALQALAEIYYDQGNLKRAWEYSERSLTLKEKLGDQIGRGNSIGFRGSICLVLGEYTKSLEYFEQSLQIMEEIKNISGKASILTDMGVAYLGLNQIEEAKNKLLQGIELWESVRGNLGGQDSFKVSIFEQQARTYNILLAVLIDQEKPLPALEIAERSRAREPVDLSSKKLNGQSAEKNGNSPTIKEIRKIAQEKKSTLVEQDYFILKMRLKVSNTTVVDSLSALTRTMSTRSLIDTLIKSFCFNLSGIGKPPSRFWAFEFRYSL